MALAAGSSGSADAARPLLDKGQWDAYFALFARDDDVPWKPSSVRLDTYSGAPVDFAAYAVDPADVILAGQNRTRAIDTSHRRAIARWRFSPPPGQRFEANDVAVPLGSQEGFYVIEARRGDAVQQVWLNRTHIGLVTAEGPDGLAVWGVDLRSGRALQTMTVDFLVGLQLVERKTDPSGMVVWRERDRPAFALAEEGAGRAFVSLLPQAPLPSAVVGLRLESAVARAGSTLRFAGFARRRVAAGLRRASGDVRVTLAREGRTLATATSKLDAAGAFEGGLAIPVGLADGDYAILAAAAGGVGGTSVHVDAAGDLALAIGNGCPCAPDRPVRVTIVATRSGEPAGDLPIRVHVVRTPHVVPPGANEDSPRWGTTVVLDSDVHSDVTGRAIVSLPTPSDGLDSSYGIRATTAGASATTRVVVSNARVALALTPDQASVDVGAPAGFAIYAFDVNDGEPAAALPVHLRLSHGTTVQESDATLDARGRGHVVFREPSFGSNLLLGEAKVDGHRALDACAVLVEPSALSGAVAASDSGVTITLDRARYRPGDRVVVHAHASGAAGQALFTVEGARAYASRLASVEHGDASASLDLGDPQGDVRVVVAFVRNGAVALGSAPVTIDGPGRARATTVTLDQTAYAPGSVIHATVHDGVAHAGATFALRIADGVESDPALFDDAPDLLTNGGTTAQNPAADNPTWHAYVAPASSKANDIFAAERPRKVATDVAVLGAAAPRTLVWNVERSEAGPLTATAPLGRGRYVLSILKISDDGDVGAGSVSFDVQ